MGRSPPPEYKLERSKTGLQDFAKQPVGFFKGRKPLWWVWWIFRAGALVGALIAFVLLLRNFYVFEKKCQWCKYLSCLVRRIPTFAFVRVPWLTYLQPIKNWCDIGNLAFTDQTNSKARRMTEVFVDALRV